MRASRIIYIVCVAFLICACSDSTEPRDPVGMEVEFSGQVYPYEDSSVWISGRSSSTGLDEYWVNVAMRDTLGDFFSFSVQGPDYDREGGLLAIGELEGTGGTENAIRIQLSGENVFFENLSAQELSLVWLSTSIEERTFSGQGYIAIKEHIYFACRDSIYSAGGLVGPGDPSYDEYFERLCEPGYSVPRQILPFTCTDELITWERED